MLLLGVCRLKVGLAGPRSGDGSREREAHFISLGEIPLQAREWVLAGDGHRRSRTIVINSGDGPVPTRTCWLRSALRSVRWAKDQWGIRETRSGAVKRPLKPEREGEDQAQPIREIADGIALLRSLAG
jgi:hypothetical protein